MYSNGRNAVCPLGCVESHAMPPETGRYPAGHVASPGNWDPAGTPKWDFPPLTRQGGFVAAAAGAGVIAAVIAIDTATAFPPNRLKPRQRPATMAIFALPLVSVVRRMHHRATPRQPAAVTTRPSSRHRVAW